MIRRALASLLLAVACVRTTGTPTSVVPNDTVEIQWDRWQVPHVLASTRQGLARGLGYAQLRAYPEEILQLYAQSRGEAAAIWGAAALQSDRAVRMLDLPQRTEQAYAARSPEMRAWLDAFAAGMNEFASAHPERLSAQARQVLPVRPQDPIAQTLRGMLAFTLLTGQRPLVLTIDGHPTAALGSNLWAIAPSRSASGHAMLLANPHLPWQPSSRMFEAHLVGPDAPLYGVASPGAAWIGIGFNDAIAWSLTINVIDTVDFFVLVPDGDGYRFDGKRRAFESHEEIVRVRADDGTMRTQTVTVRRSVHGPVLPLADGRLVAVRSALDGAEAGWVEAYVDLGRARALTEFEAVLRRMHLPMFNVGYADRDGHVLLLSAGRVPRRAGGHDWFQPVPGDSSATLWRELLPYEALPRVVDPPGGFVQNSNSVPWLATVPQQLDPAKYREVGIPPGPLGLREIHGLELLLADDSISFDELRAMQHSVHLELADHVLDELLALARASTSAPARRAAEVLARWDRRASSPGAVLFEAWAKGIDWRANEGFAEPWSAREPFTTPRGLADPKRALADLEAAALALEQRHGTLEVEWNAVHRLRDGLGSAGAPDSLGSFHVIDDGVGDDGIARPVAGDTFVALVELRPEGPRAEVLLTYGNASPDAPFAADQLELLAKGELRTPLLDRASIEAGSIEHVRLHARVER